MLVCRSRKRGPSCTRTASPASAIRAIMEALTVRNDPGRKKAKKRTWLSWRPGGAGARPATATTAVDLQLTGIVRGGWREAKTPASVDDIRSGVKQAENMTYRALPQPSRISRTSPPRNATATGRTRHDCPDNSQPGDTRRPRSLEIAFSAA